MQRFLANIFQSYLFPLIAALVFVIESCLSNGIMGGADSFAHFLIAKYAITHPELFFDHWGKPIFTLLAAIPSVAFGVKGVIMLNVLLGLLTSLFTTLILKKEGLLASVGASVLFTPYFASLHISGLTEPLFACVLTAGIYAQLRNQYHLAGILFGSLLFIRTEGVLFISLFACSALFVKQYWALAYTAFVPLLVIIAGGIAKSGDFLWFITEMPYGVKSAYEAGSIFHFIAKADIIFGLPLLVFGLLGMGLILLNLKYYRSHALTLVVFPTIYFLFHSTLFGFGLGASAGLTRVMIVLIPILSINSGLFINWFATKFGDKKNWLAMFFITWVIVQYVSSSRMPVEETTQQKVLNQIAVKHKNALQKVYYLHPAFAAYSDCDPFAGIQCKEGFPENFQSKELFIWDSHFGNEQQNLTKEALFKKHTYLKPVDEYSVNNFEVIVFEAIDQPE